MTLPGRSRIDRGSYGGKLGRNRCGALVVIVRLYLPAHAAAQAVDGSAVCWRPEPRAQCRTFLLANVGIHARLREVSAGGEGPAAVVLDYGLMVNVTSRDAVGASVFASLETNDAVGPAIHYRRWFDGNSSFDLALGVPVNGKQSGVLGLLKVHPASSLGLALRPKLIRARSTTCTTTSCVPVTSMRFGATAGLELDGPPAVWVTGVGLVAVLVFTRFCCSIH